MAVTKEQKKEILADLIEKFKKAKSVAFAENKGLTVGELAELRGGLRAKNAEMKVAKKTLVKLAAKEVGYEVPDEVLVGAVGTVFSYDDVVAGAKSVNDFAKKHPKVDLLGGLMDGKVLLLAEIKTLASLPSKEELIAKLLYMLKYPITGFHGVLKGTMAGFVRVLDGIAKKAPAPAAPAPVAAAEPVAPAAPAPAAA
jgi:large subunit ribosomal protein L10